MSGQEKHAEHQLELEAERNDARRRPVMVETEYLDRDGYRHSYKVPSRHFLDEDGAPLKGGCDE